LFGFNCEPITRPKVNAGPIERNFKPVNVATTIGSLVCCHPPLLSFHLSPLPLLRVTLAGLLSATRLLFAAASLRAPARSRSHAFSSCANEEFGSTRISATDPITATKVASDEVFMTKKKSEWFRSESGEGIHRETDLQTI